MPDQSETTRTLHAVVTGRVHGVGFRFWVLGQARRLGLVGSVRNLPTGHVEVLARGAEENLQALVGALHQGPPLSRVDQVQVEWDAPVPQAAEFIIAT